MNIRKSYAKNFNQFISSKYEPSEAVFGQIEDNKPWWGLSGIMCKSKGERSIDGLSEESRYINNPLLLIAIDLTVAVKDDSFKCGNIYPVPVKSVISPSSNTITTYYDIGRFERIVANTAWQNVKYKYSFKGLNARDLSMPNAYLQSFSNIEFEDSSNISNRIHAFIDFLHTGGSCGYQGGCNNGSPYQSGLSFRVTKLPARAEFVMFRKNDSTPESNPDLKYIIVMN